MTTDAAQLARLRVAAATGRLPPDLGAWALRVCDTAVGATERRDLRNALLRQAAAVHGGTRWAASGDILAALLAFRREPLLGTAVTISLASYLGYCQQAWRVDPARPRSRRQILSVLEVVKPRPCAFTTPLWPDPRP